MNKGKKGDPIVMHKSMCLVIMIAACTLITCRQEPAWTGLLDSNLSQWEMYLGYALKPGYQGEIPLDDKGDTIPPIGYNHNANNVFSVVYEEGIPVLRISGEIYGCVFTRQEFENYHLKLKVKWGTKKWDPRRNDPMDSGILYHSQGECGHDFWRAWMLSQEFQIMEKSFGDFWSQMTSQIDIRAAKPEGVENFRYDPAGPSLPFGAESVNGGYCQRSEDFEKPGGEWNTVELICFGDKSLHIVNGHVVMALSGSRYLDGAEIKPLTKGKIQLQSEAAEVYYKDIQIKNIGSMPAKYAAFFN